MPESWLPLLSAKLMPARVPPYAVHRPRINERLDGPWKVAVVTGGPGTGKSVVVAQWFESLAGTRRAWVSLDPSDDRPASFWLTIACVLDRAAPGAFRRTMDLASAGASGAEGFLVVLAAESAALTPPVALVLEDLHTIHDRRILDGLAFLIEHLADGLQVLITSRVDPRLPIGRWRTRPWFVEIRQHDLNFTPVEAEALFAAMGEERLDPADIEHLTTHTEGWAAALQLAALSMRRHDEPSAVARRLTGRHHMIADLLLSEVVEGQPEDVQEFMLNTSVAHHFDAELCEVLTGRTDSAEILRSLEAQMLFLLSVDDERSTYRFHHLLAELLLAELTRRDPGRVEQLHRSAAAVLEARGEIVAAVHHLVAAGQWDRAFALAFGTAFARWDHNDTSAAAAWLDLFPTEYIESTVPRMLTYSMALGICKRFDEGAAWLDRAVARVQAENPPRETDVALLDAMQVILLSCHDGVADGVMCGERAVEAVDQGFDLGTAGARARPNLVRAYLLDDRVDDAQRVITTTGPPGDELATVLLGPAVSARVAWRCGHLTEAARAATRALNGAAALGVPQHFGTLDAYLAQAATLIDRNELAEAGTVVEHMVELARRFPFAVYRVLVRIEKARLLCALGDLDEARVVIDQMRDRASRGGVHPRLQRIVDQVEARWFIDVAETARAAEIVARLPSPSPTRTLLEARLHLARHEPELAVAALDRPLGSLRDELAAEVLRAQAALQSDSPEIAAHVDRVVALASEERHVLTILDEGPVLSRLVRGAAEASATRAGQQFALALGAAPAPARRLAPPKPLLTDREMSVLRYLPSRLSNQELARELFMSVNTVKTHLKNIYAKIGASSRSDAVHRARALGLL